MTTVNPSEKTKHWVTYLVLGAIFLALAIIALGVFRSAKSSVQAQAKADQLLSAITAEGLPAPSKDQVVTVLGDDGGAICADPNHALQRAIHHSMMTNGAAGPGMRPVIADPLAVRGQILVMQIYCPEELPEFLKYADSLKFDDVVKE